ncbi:putative chitinase [Medicago truncatula]|uniref:Putative chitinase n=1 Tax=Medicago truncatula TaxID=3880 RepID=A0A396I7X0_MEDTR|nr:putative chitinase [Medicago truncatula]
MLEINGLQVKLNKFFLCVSVNAASAPSGGFIPSDVFISQVLRAIKSFSKYGGVMIRDRFNDVQSGLQS